MKSTTVAFIAHPLSMRTLSVISGVPTRLIGLVSKNLVKKLLEKTNPFVFMKLQNLRSKNGSVVNFIGIACPLLPDQMVMLKEEFVLEKIMKSVRLAEKEGAQIVSLGGFTSVIGNEGEQIAKSVPNIAVTSGNTYTAMLAIQGVLKASQIVGLDIRVANIAIVGATGDIGSACTNFFVNKCDSISLAARNEKRLSDFADNLVKNTGAKVAIYQKTSDAIKNADIVITATSALTTIIQPQDLKTGAIVCDVALPANIAREVSRQRKDALVFEGGLCSVPFYKEIQNRKWNTLMPINGIYGCVAEGLLLGLENIKVNYSIGRGQISSEKLEQIWAIAEKHGFGLSDFFCGDYFYSKDHLKELKGILQKAKETRSYVS